MAKSYTYIVSGRWPFPVDMLRHDEAYPVGSEDAVTISQLSGLERPHDQWDHGYAEDRPSRNIYAVTLRSRREPTIDRWKSFGWDVRTVVKE